MWFMQDEEVSNIKRVLEVLPEHAALCCTVQPLAGLLL
jgi:hypothetical protein